jgi:AI-2 transport protein TqsA
LFSTPDRQVLCLCLATRQDVWYLGWAVPLQGVSEIAKETTSPEGPLESALTPAGPPEPASEDSPTAPDRDTRTGGLRDNPSQLLLTLACLVVVILGLRYAAGVLNLILVGLFVVMGLSPVVDWLRRRKVPAWLTITIVLVAFLAIAAALIAVLVSYLNKLGLRIDVYKIKLTEMIADIERWSSGHGVDTSSFFSRFVNVDSIANSVTSLLGSVLDAFSNIVLMVMIVLFMLAQVYSFPRRVYSRLHLSDRFERSFGEFGEVTRSYLFTKGWLALIAAVISTGIYYAFGVDFALLWGILFFVLSFIPNFGFVLSIIPPFVVTLLEYGFTRAALVVAVVVVMNTIVDNVIAPRFMSRSVGLSTLAVFLSLIVWAWILGPVGALISIPLTLMVKLLVLDSYESTRFISLFLTGGREMDSAADRKRRKKRDCSTED